MKYDEFVGRVQSRARLGTQGNTVRAIRATLEVLGQRLFGNEAQDLAAQLPHEIGIYLEHNGQDGDQEAFGIREFYERVSQREGVDLPDAVYHARCVVSVVKEAVSPGEIEDVRSQLPAEYNELFEADVH